MWDGRTIAGIPILESERRNRPSFGNQVSMNRRTFLRNGVTVGCLVALSGCTNQTLKEGKSQAEPFDELYDEEKVDLPVQQKLEDVEQGVLLAKDAEIGTLDDFKTYLEEGGLAVEDVSEDVVEGETILSVEYVVNEEMERGRALEVGIVAGAYAALIDAEFDSEELDATLLDPDGKESGEFTIRTEAAEHYNEGKTSAQTYGKEAMKELHST